MDHFDLGIVGGGIVGLATAYRFLNRFPDRSVVIWEKENDLMLHQTGHNSGVLHSGVYYPPSSLKAKNCTVGKQLLEQFCRQSGIAFDLCGKVVVAVDESELAQLQVLHERATANGVTCSMIDRDALLEIEPHAAGIKALFVPGTGIISFRDVGLKFAERVREMGGQIRLNEAVTAIRNETAEIVVETNHSVAAVKNLINCAGLYCDKVYKLAGGEPPVQICPFRGEYYLLKAEHTDLCRTLIYPVPDPRYPFLGVHFTRRVDGTVECGPNAVLAFAREGYSWKRWNFAETAELIRYSGFRRFIAKNIKTGVAEMYRSLSKRTFVHALQKLVPEVREDHVVPAGSGVRAQAIWPDGRLENDFLIRETPRAIHLLNAPSPAATSCLSIAETLLSRFESTAQDATGLSASK